jgi:hypothetical protein
VGGRENGGAGEREDADLGVGRAAAQEEGGKRSGGRKLGGRERKRMGGAGQLGATRHPPPPIPNVVCTCTSPFGDVWQCATLANAMVKKKFTT